MVKLPEGGRREDDFPRINEVADNVPGGGRDESQLVLIASRMGLTTLKSMGEYGWRMETPLQRKECGIENEAPPESGGGAGLTVLIKTRGDAGPSEIW